MIQLGNVEAFKCLEVQGKITDYVKRSLLAEGKIKDNGMLKFLLSGENIGDVKQLTGIAIGEQNNRLKVRLRHDLPYCFQVVRKKFGCNDLTAPFKGATGEQLFELGDVPYMLQEKGKLPTDLGLAFEWDGAEYQQACIDNHDIFTKAMAQGLMAFDKMINRDLIAQITTTIGTVKQPDGTWGAKLRLPLFTETTITAQNTPNIQVDMQMRRAYSKVLMQDRYAVIGGDNFNMYSELRGYGSQSAWGMDISKTRANYPFMYDMDWDLVQAPNTWMTIPYGAVQLLQWNEYKGLNAINYPDSKHFILMTPEGLKVDVAWQHDTKQGCNKIKVIMKCYVEPVVLAQKGGCDVDAGANGIFKFEDCSTSILTNC